MNNDNISNTKIKFLIMYSPKSYCIEDRQIS